MPTPRRPTVDLRTEQATDPEGANPTIAAATDEDRSRVGQILHAYRLGEVLGAGSVAVVYKARHEHLPRDVAVKVLRGRWVASDSVRERMAREAATLLDLRHPNVVSLVDFGLTAEGLPFIVTELVVGRTLRAHLDRVKRLSVEDAAAIGAQIMHGLCALHERGLAHRDLKPSNVMLADGDLGQVKILDLGLVTAAPASAPLTRPNEMIGTPLYMAPEQIHRESPVGPEADRYALGVMLYEMITGAPPFRGTALEVMHAHIHSAASPAELGRLGSLVSELLAKKPEARPGSSPQIGVTLEAVAGPALSRASTSLLSSPTKLVSPTRDERSLPRSLLAALSLLLALLALLVALFK